MKELAYLHNKSESYSECGISLRDKNTNCHHIEFRRDIRKLPKNFPINSRCNLVPLPKKVHEKLHQIIDTNPWYRNDLTLRVYFANMAYNGELDLIPRRMYQSNPEDIFRRDK